MGSPKRKDGRPRLTTSPPRKLWNHWRLWVKIKRDGRVLIETVPAAPLLIGRVEYIGDAWRWRRPDLGWFDCDYKNKLDAVEALLKQMSEAARD